MKEYNRKQNAYTDKVLLLMQSAQTPDTQSQINKFYKVYLNKRARLIKQNHAKDEKEKTNELKT